MAAFWRRFIFWKPLYSAHEVEMHVFTLLQSTVDKQAFMAAMVELQMEASPRDVIMAARISETSRSLTERDKRNDARIALRIRQALENGE